MAQTNSSERNRWLLITTVITLGLISLVQAGCSCGSSSSVTPSAITDVFPPQSSDGALVSTLVTATFRDDMNVNTINTSTFTLTVGGAPVAAASVNYDATTKTATLTPAADLVSDTEYRATISSSVEDTGGNKPLASDYVWSFTVSPATYLVSKDSNGVVGNNRSDISDIDATGQYVVFVSSATNLVTNFVTNGLNHIYRKDMITGEILLVSSDDNGLEANNSSSSPRISDDGRFVVFESTATNLSSILTRGTQQIFIKDMDDGSIELASRDLTLNAANGICTDPDVSDDGRYVVFASTAANLTAIPGGGFSQIYYKDMADESVDMLSLRTTLTTGATGQSNNTDMSADGQYIVFESNASDLISPSPTASINIYFIDISTPTNIEHISVNTAGTDAFGNSLNPSVSNDGRYVAFDSVATNLATSDNNGNDDVFLRDRNPAGSPTTILVSVDPSGGDSANGKSTSASISGDGAFIAFQSDATDIAVGNNPGLIDIFVRDMASASITINQVNIADPGIPSPTFNSANASISSDGRYVSFDSPYSFTLDDTNNGLVDIYRAYNSTF